MHTNADTAFRRILIIDDNPDLHRDYANILAVPGNMAPLEDSPSELFGQPARQWAGPHYYLAFTSQGKEGVAKFEEAMAAGNPFQLVFVAMHMPPGWDGLRTITEIWKRDARAQIVLCTASSDYSWEEINRRLGDTGNLLILKKPFDVSEIAQMASSLTEKWILAKEADLKREELERLVAKRTTELSRTNSKLKQEMEEREALEQQLIRSEKIEAIGTLAAGVAHDLNNILSGVLSYPDLMLLNMDAADPLYRPLSVIKSSGHKAAAIVQDMLTLARRNVAVKEPVELADIVDEFLRSPECDKICEFHPKVNIQSSCKAGLGKISGSVVHLGKSLMNLVSNAAEAMPDGGTITLDMCKAYLQRELPGYDSMTPGDYILLSVTDQGQGISQEDRTRIFEPFYTKKKMGRSGTGLGLTVVESTVRDHDGYIEIKDPVKGGTAICIYLPLSGEAGDTAARTDPDPQMQGHGEHVLVVDDMAQQREIATSILEKLGYQVTAVNSGESALEFVARQPVDLLILDMVMDPGIDGLETYQRIISQYPQQKAIIASGYSQTSRVNKALALGAHGFVRKPYTYTQIGQAVRNALEN